MIRLQRCFAVFMSVVLLAGCGGSSAPKTYTVTGTVSFDGTPVERGTILFRQTTSEARGFSGEIKNGKYEIKAEAGDMKVIITASRDTGKMIKDENGDTVPQVFMFIPKKYNDQTTLTATVKTESQAIPFELTK